MKSEVSDLTAVKVSDNSILVNYLLTATDKTNQGTVTNYFNGTVEMVMDNGTWKINEITNKAK